MASYAVVRMIDDANVPTVKEFVTRYLDRVATSHAKGTMRNNALALGMFAEFVGDIRIWEVTAERADAWHVRMLKEYASNTARLRISIVKAAFEYALSLHLIQENPFAGIKLPKIIFGGRSLSDQILRKFLDLLPRKLHRPIRLILHTGMRRNEAFLLDWSEVIGSRIVLSPGRTKNRKGRTIYLNAAARRCLGPRKSGRVFAVAPGTANKIVTRTWKKLGLGRIRIHDMRHTAATKHYERNHDDYAMMETFGWASPESAKPYHHVTDLRAKKAMQRLTYSL